YSSTYPEGSTRAIIANYHSLRPDYYSGFRLFANTYKTDCCHLFFVEWAHLHGSDQIAFSSPLSNIVFPFLADVPGGTVKASLEITYDKVSIRAGRYVSSHCESLGYVFGGLRYVNIERFQRAARFNSAVFVRNTESGRFSGGALEIGYGVEAVEPCSFSLVGQLCGLMAVGERRLRQQLVNGTAPGNVKRPTETAWVCGCEMRLGARYRHHWKACWIDLEFGFEMDQYFNALKFSTAETIELAGDLGLNYVNVGFAGPYASASVRF
ncbi:MAG: hypothetical protein JSR80_07300, partial [Verrucomicrobia bacterium]|nr:hypothetical protein [Verrucomicrobiota bacterium]